MARLSDRVSMLRIDWRCCRSARCRVGLLGMAVEVHGSAASGASAFAGLEEKALSPITASGRGVLMALMTCGNMRES